MKEARIFHCEDSPIWQELVDEHLEESRHKVVARAERIGQALNMLDDILNDVFDVNVVLLDGHLQGGAVMNHPDYFVKRARHLRLRIPIIGLSIDGLARQGLAVGPDLAADILKAELTQERLLEELAILPEPE